MRKITGLKIENGSTCFGLNMVGHAHPVPISCKRGSYVFYVTVFCSFLLTRRTHDIFCFLADRLSSLTPDF